MLIGSLVEWHVGLDSCLCFSHLEKLVLKACSTPPRYLAVCRASSVFSNRNPDSFSIPGGSIENGSASSIASRHLVDRSRSFQPFVDLSLDRSSINASVNVYYARHLSRHLSIDRDPLTCIIFHMFFIFLNIFVSIASCFSFSCRSMVPCSPYSLYVSFLFVSVMSFGFLCPLTIVSKRRRNLRIECHSSGE